MSTAAAYELIEHPQFITPSRDEFPDSESAEVENGDSAQANQSPEAALLHNQEHSLWITGRTPTFAITSIEPNKDEQQKIALDRRPKQLALSFLAHLIPVGITISMVQLSFRSVYCFDIDENNDSSVHINRHSIDLNELLNALQFAAKIHEILMIGSLSAIVLHFVRIYLVGIKGLPFGLLTAGYSVGSAEYIFNKAFWGSGFNRIFWAFSTFVVFCTLLANMLGPSSAIALIPNLDWWKVDNPFSGQQLPIGFKYSKDALWPANLSLSDAVSPDTDTYSADACISTGFLDLRFCPASGFNEIDGWAKAFANEDIAPEVTMTDFISNAKRLVTSELTERSGEGKTAIAISTSITQNLATTISSFGQFLKSRDFTTNNIARPKLGPKEGEVVLQPLVQVQCEPLLLPQFAYFRPSLNNRSNTDSSDINTFSNTGNTEPHSWTLPDWLQTYTYNIMEQSSCPNGTSYGNMINVTWVDIADHEASSASIAAIVIAPFVGCDAQRTNCSQYAFAHTCSINARWAGSNPFVDPVMSSLVQHNLTDLLLFQKPNTAATDFEKYGISPTIDISSSWANFLNIPIQYADPCDANNVLVAGSLEWILSSFIFPVSIPADHSDTSQPSNTYFYDFSPASNLAANATALVGVQDVGMAASETIATVLSIAMTDGLARVASAHDYFVGIDNGDDQITAINLEHFTGEQLYLVGQSNLTLAEWVGNFPYELYLGAERYGYSYGLQSPTVIFGISILLIHTFVSVSFLIYVTHMFVWRGAWTSRAWSDMAELAALLINSDKTEQLQNTCAGVESVSTWRQRVRIREIADGHLGVAIGDGKENALGQVMLQKKYGKTE